MSTVNTTNNIPAAMQRSDATTGSTQSLGQEQFLALMIAQLKNQDPMKPMENGEFLSQMAQFGTVNGIQELQKSFADLATSLQSNQALMASSLVGRTVLAPGNEATLVAGGTVSGAAVLESSAPGVVVTITDPSGQVVQRLALGAQEAGTVGFTWDGRKADGTAAAAGKYEFSVQAVSYNGSTALQTLMQARVDSVTLGGTKGLVLNLSGGGTAYLADVHQIG
jgi:flagellar basal-body rod modification protein FlgD